MRTTIGEIVDIILPYSNIIEMSMINNTPFIRTRLSDKSGFTQAYLYILQTNEHVYSIADDNNDTIGERYFPTGSVISPFVKEKDLIQIWYKGGENNNEKIINNNIPYNDFFNIFYTLLWKYEIIKFNPKLFKMPISDINFASKKVLTFIEKGLYDQKCNNFNIQGLVDTITKYKKQVCLGNIRQKEIKDMIYKMKQIGIDIQVNKNCIVNISFIKI